MIRARMSLVLAPSNVKRKPKKGRLKVSNKSTTKVSNKQVDNGQVLASCGTMMMMMWSVHTCSALHAVSIVHRIGESLIHDQPCICVEMIRSFWLAFEQEELRKMWL